MTALPPDPEPDETPGGAEPGGGVSPGETPPDSGSTTAGLAHRDPPIPSRAPAVFTMVAVGVLVVLVVGFVIATAVLRLF